MTPGGSEAYVVNDGGPATLALTSLLATAGIPSRTFDNGSAFLRSCGRLPPGCVITSLETRGMQALEFLRRLGEAPGSFPAIMIASNGEVMQAVEAMKAGAATVLERPYGDETLLRAVRSALTADTPADTQPPRRTALAGLTQREYQVLRGVVDGKTNKMSARHLGISPRTVEVYRASMMRKAGVSSVPELVRLAMGAERFH